jgi:O-antigen ligase
MQLSKSDRFSQRRPDGRRGVALGVREGSGTPTSFKLFLIWTFILFGRPQDYLPFLALLRPALILTVLTLIATMAAQERMSWSDLFKIGIARKYTLFYLLMIFGIPFANMRYYAFAWTFLFYSVNMIYFYVALLQLNSAKRIISTVYVLTLAILFYGCFGLVAGGLAKGRFSVGTMYDPNDIALFMVGLSPMSIFFLRRTNKTRTRVMAAAVLGIALLITLMAASRGGLLSLLAVLLLLFFTKAGRLKLVYKIAVVAAVVSMFFVIEYRYEVNLARYDTLMMMKKDYNVTSETGRLETWKTAFKLVSANPITGVGAACFPRAFGYERAVEGRPPAWRAAHSAYIQIWTELGYPGIIVFLVIIYGCLRSFLRTMKLKAQDEETEDIPFLAGLILIAFAGHLVGSSFLSQAYSAQFTLFFVFGAALDNLLLRQPNSDVARHHRSRLMKSATPKVVPGRI